MSPSRNAESPDLPDSPSSPSSPAPIPAPRVSPLFKAPTSPAPAPPSSSQSPATHPDGSPSQLPAAPDPTWSTSKSSNPAPSESASSDTRSTGSGVKLSKAGLRAAVGTGFRQVCRAVAAFVADEEEREKGVFAPDEEDVDGVSQHAANIVYRRLPDEAKGGDIVDLMGLGLALLGYVGKSMRRRDRLRAVRQQQEAQGITVDQDEERPARMPTFPGGGF